MCRLLAWVSPQPYTAGEVGGPRVVSQFTDLARLHADGWGMAWWDGEPPPPPRSASNPSPSSARSTICAADDPAFTAALRSVRSDAGIVHLRWASPGMAVTEENCHPFVRGDLALAHNGGIHPMSRLDQILPPEWEATMRGTTDSERYTLALAAGREAGGRPVADVIIDVVVRLFAEWSPSSLNAMCLTPESVLVVSAYNPNAQAPVPSQSVDEYYALGYQEGAEGIVIASSGIDQPPSQGWRLIDNMTVVEIHRHTLAMEFRAVPVEAPAQAVSGETDRVLDP